MKVIGYVRVSTDKQDVEKQKHQLEQPITYNSYRYFVHHEEELLEVWQTGR